MRDLEIKHLGAPAAVANSAKVANWNNNVSLRSTQTFSEMIKSRFVTTEPRLQEPKTMFISDLNMPAPMLHKLVDVATAQHFIPENRPVLNDKQENLVIGNDYIKDGTFKQKAFSEV